MEIDYSAAQDLAEEVRAFAIIESKENPLAIGDDGQAYGPVQLHPASFRRYYGGNVRFAPSVADTWTDAFIKACAAFLAGHSWRNAAQAERDLIVQAWNLGEAAVFIERRRNPDYLARWKKAYESVRREKA